MILEILTYPNPLLNKVSKPIDRFDDQLKRLSLDMIDTMRFANGIGLAAPQIGQLLHLIVVEVPKGDEEGAADLLTICNPVIVKSSGQAKIEEGCLSLPDFELEVDRFKTITLNFQDVEGHHQTLEADNLLSICIQHEMDHLNGKLLVNYASSMQKDMYLRDIKKKKSTKNQKINIL